MSKRKANDNMAAEPAVTSTGRSRRNNTPAAAAAAAVMDDTDPAAAAAAESVTAAATPAEEATPARRGGRQAAVAEVRPVQLEAQKRVATEAVDGVECPSWYGFKNAEFVTKRTAGIGPGRQWRNVRQIIDRDNFHLMPPEIPTHVSIRSTPSSLPARKYCDVTGLPASYTDPKTHLHFHSASEYQAIKAMRTETIKLMLEIRGATPAYTLMLR